MSQGINSRAYRPRKRRRSSGRGQNRPPGARSAVPPAFWPARRPGHRPGPPPPASDSQRPFRCDIYGARCPEAWYFLLSGYLFSRIEDFSKCRGVMTLPYSGRCKGVFCCLSRVWLRLTDYLSGITQGAMEANTSWERTLFQENSPVSVSRSTGVSSCRRPAQWDR